MTPATEYVGVSTAPSAGERSVIAALRAAVATVQDENVTLLAAGVAYYAFVSLVPLLLLALGVASLVGGAALAERVVAGTDQILTAEAQSLLRETLTANAGAGGATVAGLVVLTWSGLKLFRALDRAFSEVYGDTGGTGLLSELRNGLVVLATVGVGVAAVAVAGGAVTRVVGAAAPLVRALSVLTLAAAFLPLYYVFPGRPITVREALPGTVFAAVGWSVLGSVFGVYADVAGGSVYGVLGAALLVVTWLYLGALVLMIGAVVNATMAGAAASSADRQVQQARPSPDGRMADDEVERESTEDADDAPEADADGATTGADAGVDAPGVDPETTVGSDGATPASGPANDAGPSLDGVDAETAEEVAAVRTDVEQLREQLQAIDERIEERTVSRSDLEADLEQYVRSRQRRGHARGWGPYLVLLYGTAMTLGAFFYLEGAWAIAAMLVVWLSTLGLYALMVLVGLGLGGVAALGKLRDLVGSLRG